MAFSSAKHLKKTSWISFSLSSFSRLSSSSSKWVSSILTLHLVCRLSAILEEKSPPVCSSGIRLRACFFAEKMLSSWASLSAREGLSNPSIVTSFFMLRPCTRRVKSTAPVITATKVSVYLKVPRLKSMAIAIPPRILPQYMTV